MADQNELLVEGSGWLRRFLGEMFGENAQLEVEIEGNPCPKADLALQIELASEVLQGRLDVENAIRHCRETQAAVLGKVNAEVGVAQRSQVADKITSES